MEKLTKEQVMERYGKVPLKFSSYFKYAFAYAGIAPDGAKVGAVYGGSSDDIYRYDVRVDSTITLEDAWMFANVTKDGKEIWSESEWS